MDSPCLVHLGFLLLAVAAPRPNTAMPRDPPADRTHNSGRTSVTVYHCEDSGISTDKSCSNEGFAKIAETQNETFSNEIIELVTKESCILMCFKKANPLPGGIYAIFWEKPEGAGHSCGNPKSAFSGTRRCNISIEENKICCEAETDMWKPKHTLNCYGEVSSSSPRKSTREILDEGIPGSPDPSTNKDGIIISLTFLVIVLCAGVVTMYCYRRHQRKAQACMLNRQASDKKHLTGV